ncbi:PREDICTED: uncharacterized protein LOC106125656 [Papilio xuthus]|uniref:Uncharacterized protein LOC106125656 n=1 Tax=Papilio xuthus TaxID=66420 RepID=A0AAJ7EI93_PAPXU|nr:PREDICTED: uncharacterized protein LOC106125656 [Papilio xuthus]
MWVVDFMLGSCNKMKLYIILLTICCVVFGHTNDRLLRRRKRGAEGAAGALDIVTNNAQPIHAEVKRENAEVAEKVTPPKEVVFETKSLRKSTPLTTKLDLIRGISRIITLSVLALSAIFEFFPFLRQAYDAVIEIMYNI